MDNEAMVVLVASIIEECGGSVFVKDSTFKNLTFDRKRGVEIIKDEAQKGFIIRLSDGEQQNAI